MSFDNYDNVPGTSGMISPAKECKPNYEEQASITKAKLESIVRLEKSLFAFADLNGIYAFKKISSYAEFVGGLAIIAHDQERYYAELLTMLEKE